MTAGTTERADPSLTLSSSSAQDLQRFDIFISHKVETEGPLAKYIKEQLEKVTGGPAGRLQVHISEDILRGKPWLEEIRTQLRQSHMLLLLFTDPTSDWDWCLFEAGLVWGQGKPIVCLHHPDNEPPNQLQHLQALPATSAMIGGFVRRLLTTTDYQRWSADGGAIPPTDPPKAPLLEEVKKDWCDTFSQEVQRLIRGTRSRVLLSRLIIEVGCEKLREDKIPDSARIHDPSPDILKLFGMSGIPEKGLTWGDVRKSAIRSPDKQWITDLARTLYKAHGFETVEEPKQGVYRRPGQVRQAYRAQLSRVEKLSDQLERFHVLFTPEPTLTRAITSFAALMVELRELFTSTEKEDQIHWLAYTPALGYLARKPDEWTRLERMMVKYAEILDIVCLGPTELAAWHNLFLDRRTDRGSINEQLVHSANTVSQQLLERVRAPSYVPFNLLPEYYLFSSLRRAIAVTPFFLPRLHDGRRKQSEKRADIPNVDMCGIVTQDRVMVDQARQVHAIIRQRHRMR
jgi:hypothetical protein